MKRVPQLLCLLLFPVFGNLFAQVSSNEQVLGLVQKLTDQNVDVRRRASETLEKMGPEAKSASSALGEALRDRDQTVRYNSAQALGRIGAEAKVAIPALAGALNDPSKDVRRSAAWALGISGAEERAAVPVLLEALVDDKEANRETAARALGRIGVEAKKALPALMNALEDVNQDVRRIAATAIGNIAISIQHANDVDSIDQLKHAYDALQKHSDRDVRDQAYVVKQAIDGLELVREQSSKEKAKGSADLIKIITVIASVAGILYFLYFLFFGQKSIPEYWRQFRDSRQPPKETMAPASVAPTDISPTTTSKVDASRVLYSEPKRLTAICCSEEGKRYSFGGFSQKVLSLLEETKQPVEIASHHGIIRDVKTCPVTERIASCADDGLVRLTDPSTKDFRIVGKHGGPVYSIAFQPGGKLIASVGKDPIARLWVIEGAPIQKFGSEPRYHGQQTKAFKHRGVSLFAVDFNRTGDLLVTAGTKGTSVGWNMQTGKTRKLMGFKETVFCVRFDPSGNFVAGSGADATIRVWNLITDHCDVLKGHGDTVRCVSFNPSGRFLVSASKDQTVRLWDLTSNQSWVLEGHTDYVYAVEFHPDGKRIVSVSGDGTLREWSFPSEALDLLKLKQ